MKNSPLIKVHAFISELLDRRRQILGNGDEDQGLIYGEALLRNALLRPRPDDFPCQIVVIGPTQVGKSTLVNLLLGAEEAGVSSLAGFTRHIQGFTTKKLSLASTQAIEQALSGLVRVECRELQPDNPKQYCITEVPAPQTFAPEVSCIVWDTPDFDSTASRHYRSLVPLICAMADIIFLVVSKEKYNDLSVWQTLRLLFSVKRPLCVCINKLTMEAQKQVHRFVEEKLAQENIRSYNIHCLPYHKNLKLKALLSFDDSAILRREMAGLVSGLGNRSETFSLHEFVQHHWEDWTEALKLEHDARKEWMEKVEALLAEAHSIYEQDYLRNPHYRDTLQLTVAKLLELLEIPGAAAAIAQVRRILTWPARIIFGLDKKEMKADEKSPDRESEVLRDAFSHILSQLQYTVAKEAGRSMGLSGDWWHELWLQLEKEKKKLEDICLANIAMHQADFTLEIEQAARQLYKHLQDHPATLNSLRAARITADAAAVALALKTGGLGPADLILAPALLSFTSLLTESSVGHYIGTVEQKLKIRQAEAVREKLWAPLKEALMALPQSMDQTKFYGIPAERLIEVEEILNRI